MSGGSLDYFYSSLEDHVGDFRDKELDHLVSDLSKLFHYREWYLSGDICEGEWREARDRFKAKWFTDLGRQERIEKYIAEFSEEVRQTFGMSNRYCKNCSRWTEEDEPYGKCDINKHCLMHRSESCNKFEERHEDEGVGKV